MGPVWIWNPIPPARPFRFDVGRKENRLILSRAFNPSPRTKTVNPPSELVPFVEMNECPLDRRLDWLDYLEQLTYMYTHI